MKQKILNLILAVISLASFSNVQPMMRAMAARSARPPQMVSYAKRPTLASSLKQPKSSCLLISAQKQEKRDERNWYKQNKNFNAPLYPQNSSYGWTFGITAVLTAWGLNYVMDIKESEKQEKKEKALKDLNVAFAIMKSNNSSKIQEICDYQFKNLALNNNKISTDNYLKLLSVIETCKKEENLIKRDKLTPTQRHLLDNRTKALESDSEFSIWINKPELQEASDTIIALEKQLMKQGHYTLVHGQRKSVYFPSQLYTLLWEISNKTKTDDYIFPWIKEPKIEKEKLIEESKRRENGLKYQSEKKIDPEDTLFLNDALWANIFENSESSAYYMRANYNWKHGTIDIKKVFHYFEFSEIYEQYSNEIESLNSEYSKLSSYGNALLFAIPKHMINDVAYYAHAYGSRISLYGSTKNVFENHMGNHTESMAPPQKVFCMPMTFDMALNPKSGIKIFPVITGDQAKLKELQAKEKALFEKIRKTATESKK